MPVVVIGGGLTAIDTATESLAYYVVQVEKFLAALRGTCCRSAAKQRFELRWTPKKRRRSRTNSSRTPGPSAPSGNAAAREGRHRTSSDLLNSWGGVTIAYRRRLIDSPSYTLNHEEVAQGARGRRPVCRVPVARSG